MPLEYTHRDGSSGSGEKGIFIQDATIKTVNDLSGTMHPRINKTFDLYLLFTLDIGRDFDPTFEVFGNLKRDANNKAVEWGETFKIGELFHNVGLKLMIGSDEKIPMELLNTLVGRKFCYLKYIKGMQKKDPTKPLWVNWDITGKEGEHEKLKKYFLARVKANRIKDFHPEAGSTDDASFDPKSFAEPGPTAGAVGTL